MKALVTGGLGFIGSHVVDLLVENNFHVTIVDNLSTGSRAHENKRAHYLTMDLEEIGRLDDLSFDFVFHLAALPRIQPSFDDPELHERANVISTIRLMEAMKQNNKLKKLVLSASSSCYGNPLTFPTPEDEPVKPMNPYALQKYAAEQYGFMLGRRFGIPVNSLRYFNVYGPRSFNMENRFNAYTSVLGIFHHQKSTNHPLTITGNGKQQRDFVHVRDVAKANLLAATTERTYSCYNVGAGTCYSILDMAKIFNHPYEFIPERKDEAFVTHADISKIKSELNWSPVIGLEEGIASYNN